MNEDVMYVICVPLKDMKTPPKDQKGCLVEKCPMCECNMWVSEKKRAIRKKNKNIKLFCAYCVMKDAQKNGYDIANAEVIDILKTN
jgi:hypothetical protein